MHRTKLEQFNDRDNSAFDRCYKLQCRLRRPINRADYLRVVRLIVRLQKRRNNLRDAFFATA